MRVSDVEQLSKLRQVYVSNGSTKYEVRTCEMSTEF